jgi:23S rRNA G2445 N2-methylase RlmL
VSAKNSRLHQHKNIAKTLAAAIQKRLEPLGLRPEPKEDAVLEIHVRMFQDRCTISLNTSGEHLHKRGYRLLVGEAPLRETLAAGILLKADWSQHDFFYDPMCGSGTLLIEAALLASNKAPGLQRHFAFEQAPFFQPSKWERFKREAEAAGQKTERRFLGIDVDPDMIRIAKENAARAGVGDLIDFRLADARTFEVPTGYQKAKSPFVLSNLPYGERLESRDSLPDLLIAVSQQLSGQLKGNFALVCKDAAWLKDSGFALQDRQTFENGGLKVLLLQGMI